MSEINKRIEALEAELQKLKNEVKEPKIENGKWYKTNCLGGSIFYLTESPVEDCYVSGYGFENGDWCDLSEHYWTLEQKYKPTLATHQEVEEALIKEAKKRGFKEGVRFKSALYKYDCVITTYEFDFHFDYMDMCKNVLFCNGNAIFSNGVWAEIVKYKTIKIGGRYEVKFCGDIEYNKPKGNDYTTIDGHKFTKEFWQSAKVISEHSKAKIMIGCSKQFDVSLKTINQILEKL